MNPNKYNDFENALQDMKAMHVTYANRDFDTKVFDKWARTTVSEDSCFNGMDGLTYMERHLGYRLVLRETAFDYDWKKDLLTAEITLQNVGFAPVYRKAQVELVLYDAGNGREYAYTLGPEQDIRDLAGGTMSDELKALRWELPRFFWATSRTLTREDTGWVRCAWEKQMSFWRFGSRSFRTGCLVFLSRKFEETYAED